MRERVWSVDVNGQPYISPQIGRRQFRIQFSIDISPGDAISFADIRLYNMNKGSRIAQGSSIVLRAGYSDNIDAVFTGFVTNTLRDREPGAPEIITRLICRSGQPAVDRASAQLSFGVGTRIEEVLRALAAAWPLPIDIDNAQFADANGLRDWLHIQSCSEKSGRDGNRSDSVPRINSAQTWYINGPARTHDRRSPTRLCRELLPALLGAHPQPG